MYPTNPLSRFLSPKMTYLHSLVLPAHYPFINHFNPGYRPGDPTHSGKKNPMLHLSFHQIETREASQRPVSDILEQVTSWIENQYCPHYTVKFNLDQQPSAGYRGNKNDPAVRKGEFYKVTLEPISESLPGKVCLFVYDLGLRIFFPAVEIKEHASYTDEDGLVRAQNSGVLTEFRGATVQWWLPITHPANLAYYNRITTAVCRQLGSTPGFDKPPKDEATVANLYRELAQNYTLSLSVM